MPCFFQNSPHISSSVKPQGDTGSLTQVTLINCFQWTFSVVMLPPQVPQPRVAVDGMRLKGCPPLPALMGWRTVTREVFMCVPR